MLKLCGQTVTIQEICSDTYLIEEDSWNWTDEMFEPIMKFKVGDRVIHEKYGLGIILIIHEECSLPYGVRFDNPNKDLHRLRGECENPENIFELFGYLADRFALFGKCAVDHLIYVYNAYNHDKNKTLLLLEGY